jgi:hypothetical protein
MEDPFLPYNMEISACDLLYFNNIQNSHFVTNGKTSRLLLGLETLQASLLLRFRVIIKVNAATNLKSENARSRIVVSLRGSVGTGTKGDESSTGRVSTGGFHHAMARSRFARVLKLMKR